jgi:hypothetical protein
MRDVAKGKTGVMNACRNGPKTTRSSEMLYLRSSGSAPSLSAYDTEFWHKVRLHQTYTWPVERDEGCNAAECDEAADHHTTGNILWRCSRSRQLWKRLFGRWGARDIPENEAKQAVFSWKPPSSTHD